jgi:hypothetical protein
MTRVFVLPALAFFVGGCLGQARPVDVPDHGHSGREGIEPQSSSVMTTTSAASIDPDGHGPDPVVANAEEPPSDDDVSPPIGPPPAGPAPAMKYAALDRATCEAELTKRKIGFDRVGEARGVVAPLRLTGPIGGVTFRSNLGAKQRKTATIEIYDCRLVLALDDFAKILAKHDVVEVIHLSVYRPAPAKVVLKGPGRRHPGALAIDAAVFKTRDGRTLDVQKDFHGGIGTKTCPPPKTASELRQIACEAGEQRLFNVFLTPDYNWAHRNHFHMEVTAGAKWTMVR